jgi:hypothetical protein
MKNVHIIEKEKLTQIIDLNGIIRYTISFE